MLRDQIGWVNVGVEGLENKSSKENAMKGIAGLALEQREREKKKKRRTVDVGRFE